MSDPTLTNQDPTIQSLVNMVNDADSQLKKAAELIAIAEEAGENVSAQKAQMAEARQRRDKWAATLRARGLDVT